MKTRIESLLVLWVLLFALGQPSWAQKKRVGQSGMTYLAISMCARETAMGDAATATVKGIGGLWHNPAVVADISRFAIAINQVNWLVDTKLYGAAFAYSLGDWGTIAVDLTYMDFGEIMGTRRVDKVVDYRGFVVTGDLGVEDYAVGLTYARRINDKFTFGIKIKRLHENLGPARYVVDEYEDPDTGNKVRSRETREWQLDDWGLDFGTAYNVGWKDLTFAMTLQNLSRDIKYWYEEFQLPMSLRMGVAMDLSDWFIPDRENIAVSIAADAIHPIDYTERLHFGSELLYMKKFAVRAGYKFNNDVESFTFGMGVKFEVAGVASAFDYAYASANYFKDISRLSIHFEF